MISKTNDHIISSQDINKFDKIITVCTILAEKVKIYIFRYGPVLKYQKLVNIPEN